MRTTTAMAATNGVELCYETFGDPAHPALLLVMGTGVQMTEWEPEFVAMFVEQGFHVVRFDHRDVGLSSRCDDAVRYTLDDLADDAAGLLEALGIDRAHILGASLGGMVAQCLTIRHPRLVLSLCSIMSTTGAPGVGTSRKDARDALIGPRPTTRDGVVDAAVTRGRILRGGGFPFDEDMIRRRAGAAFDRAEYPAGRARQVAAVLASGDRTDALRSVRVPTVVIHGDADPLVHLSGGEATAAAIPDARLVVIPGMGHELPAGAWPLVVEAFAENATRAAPPASCRDRQASPSCPCADTVPVRRTATERGRRPLPSTRPTGASEQSERTMEVET
ncbi:MAG: alpha/beta fold hydrolase [Ilumatobacteraceae bacterium]